VNCGSTRGGQNSSPAITIRTGAGPIASKILSTSQRSRLEFMMKLDSLNDQQFCYLFTYHIAQVPGKPA
jgi:hypothetical protein